MRDTAYCAKCGAAMLEPAALFCTKCGARTGRFAGEAGGGELPPPPMPQRPPPGSELQEWNAPVRYHAQQGATGGAPGLFPYENKPALIGYYLGCFSIIFWPLGIAALILGINGLRACREEPLRKGAGHAWAAIILGSLTVLMLLGWVGVLVAPFFVQN